MPAEDEVTAPGEDISRENGGRSELKMLVEKYAANHQDALYAVLEEAPASMEAALQHAIHVSQAGYRKALAALD